MSDWRDEFESDWADSANRETALAERITALTGYPVVLYGQGAGSTNRLNGTAYDNGSYVGAPDLQVEGTNIFIEVTGPLRRSIPSDRPLFVRPDKIRAARDHAEQENWLLHVNGDREIRVIQFNEVFFESLDNGEFPLEKNVGRGSKETMISIPAAHFCVQEFSALIDRLNSSIRLYFNEDKHRFLIAA